MNIFTVGRLGVRNNIFLILDTMRNFNFLSFWLLLTLGLATVVFNSCGKDEDTTDDPNKSTTIAVTGISLDVLTLTLAIGENHTLTATVTPENATNQTVTWTSSDNTKATVANGKVVAIAAGSTIITAKAGDETATCKVVVWEISDDIKGVVINGVKWATRNVDAPGEFAAKPEYTGMFYQWNRKKEWAATGSITDWDYPTNFGFTWDKVNDPSPAGWRVPTLEEIKSLLNAEKVVRERISVNGVSGMVFTDKTTGNSIFLPAAGSRSGDAGALGGAGSDGLYWGQEPVAPSNAYYLVFSGDLANWGTYNRRSGLNVRSVAE
jgi:uncharacterized protein (TIGR02145 family)